MNPFIQMLVLGLSLKSFFYLSIFSILLLLGALLDCTLSTHVPSNSSSSGGAPAVFSGNNLESGLVQTSAPPPLYHMCRAEGGSIGSQVDLLAPWSDGAGTSTLGSPRSGPGSPHADAGLGPGARSYVAEFASPAAALSSPSAQMDPAGESPRHLRDLLHQA